jgi:protein O-GlcNAc transferase
LQSHGPYPRGCTQEIYTAGVAPSPPIVVNGFATFGSLNSPRKISDAAVELWSAVLNASPTAKLMLAVPPDKKAQDHLASRFKPFGIEPARLILEPTRSFDRYMKLYDRIDIALDPEPYGGGITTCDALWMGVPVISRAGRTSVGRIGASLLRTIGLNDLVAENTEEYVKLATQFAVDRERLKELRRSLRGQLANSPVMNAPQYTNDLESQYRAAWKSYCASST